MDERDVIGELGKSQNGKLNQHIGKIKSYGGKVLIVSMVQPSPLDGSLFILSNNYRPFILLDIAHMSDGGFQHEYQHFLDWQELYEAALKRTNGNKQQARRMASEQAQEMEFHLMTEQRAIAKELEVEPEQAAILAHYIERTSYPELKTADRLLAGIYPDYDMQSYFLVKDAIENARANLIKRGIDPSDLTRKELGELMGIPKYSFKMHELFLEVYGHL